MPPPDSKSDAVPKNILAFRTITILLAQLQQRQTLTVDTPEVSSEDRNEARIVDAFAHLAVAGHDVVALATERNLEKLSVFACANLSGETSNQPSQLPNLEPWKVIGNHRRDEYRKNKDDPNSPVSTTLPIIVHPTPREDSEIIPIDQYLVNLEKCWKQPTLTSHLSILSELLVMKGLRKNILRPRLSNYMIAMFCPKMVRRLNHPLSRGYIQSLTGVKDFPFKPKLHGRDKASITGIKNDRAFLESFVKVNKTRPGMLKHPIPNITRVLDTLPPRGESFQLYTSETCAEFHTLLLELLEIFETYLNQLLAQKDSSDITALLRVISSVGHALAKMVRGSAFEMHLQTIGVFLKYRMATSMSNPNMAKKEEEDTERNEDPLAGCDEELEAVPPFIQPDGTLTAVWMIYRDWFRLMVVHFDAINILIEYVTSKRFPYTSISIKILVAPPVDESFLPWRELLADPNIFPSGTPSKQPNQDILEFLKKASLSISTARNHLGWCTDAQKSWDARHESSKVQTLMHQLAKVAIYADNANAIHALHLQWVEASEADKENFVDPITDGINSLCDSVRDKYEKARLPLNLEMKFKGTLHCEACLASLPDEDTRENMAKDNKYGEILKDTRGFGRVIGVSKPCCPTRQHFLSLLSVDKKPFIVRGSHSTISACTLPTWAPANIVDSMNQTFGSRLRRELLKLMESSQSKARASSMDSQRLSDISDEDWDSTPDSDDGVTSDGLDALLEVQKKA